MNKHSYNVVDLSVILLALAFFYPLTLHAGDNAQPSGNVNVYDVSTGDSDGDCIPDSVELGFTKEEAVAKIASMSSKPHFVMTALCQKILKAHGIKIFENAIKFDDGKPLTYDNIAMLYDMDPGTMTDSSNGDSDNDGVIDGKEDFNFNGRRDEKPSADELKVSKAEELQTGQETTWAETDPLNPDSDKDDLLDGEEGDRNGNGVLGENESDPLLTDTDHDGVPDADEKRFGTLPEKCDTDDDGLSDGVELGYIQPIDYNGCHGLMAADTNYKNLHAMNPLNPDSDGDGLCDGIESEKTKGICVNGEDLNDNGWVDPDETDPSITDTDGDGIDDYAETTLDFDHDGLPDFDYHLIKGGLGCRPPQSPSDLDCDGIPNERDTDSDNDGCSDKLEGGMLDVNSNNVVDIYDNQAKSCPEPTSQGNSGSANSSQHPTGGKTSLDQTMAFEGSDEGGACVLVFQRAKWSISGQLISFLALFLPVSILFRARRRKT